MFATIYRQATFEICPSRSSRGILNQVIGGWSVSGTVFRAFGVSLYGGRWVMTSVLWEFGHTTQITAQWSGTGPSSCGKPKVDASNNLVARLDPTTQFADNFNLTETGFATTAGTRSVVRITSTLT